MNDALYRAAFNASPDAMLLFREDRFIDCNLAAVRLLRAPSREAVLDRHPASLSPSHQPDGRTSMERAQENIAACCTHGAVQFEWTHLRFDGEPILVDVSSSLVEAGDHPLLLVCWRPLLAQRRLDHALQQLWNQHDPHRSAQGLADDYAPLLSTTHDALEALHERVLDRPDLQPLAAQALEATLQILDLNRRLQDAPPTGRLAGPPTDLVEAVERQADALVRHLPPRVSLALVLPPEPVLAPIAAGTLEDVLEALVTNAAQAIGTEGRIVLEVQRSDAVARVIVRDDGDGMPPDVLAQATAPYFTTRGPQGASGLGLWQCVQSLRAIGGWLRVASDPPLGSEVSIHIPLGPGSAPHPAPVGRKAPVGAHPLRVLVVDDDPLVARSVRRMLERAGHTVQVACDGVEAMTRFGPGLVPPDVVLTDALMPRMGGAELADALRRRTTDTPVVLMTSYAGEYASPDVPLPQGFPILCKPFTPGEVLAAVWSAVDR